MLLLVATLSKLYTKLDNHHHFHFHLHNHDPEPALSASLQAFRSDVSCFLNQYLSEDAKTPRLEMEALSLSLFHHCFELLPIINKAFGKLVVAIDHPFTSWEAASVEEYLSYTLYLLELLNSITSSVSHLAQARLSLSHALALVESSPAAAIHHLKAIDRLSSITNNWGPEEKGPEPGKRVCSGKELVVHEALMEMKRIGLWVCGIVLSGLSGDARPYMEMREKAGGFGDSPMEGLDSWVCDREGGGIRLKEVEEVREAAASLVAAMASGESTSSETEELQRKVERFEKMVDGLGKEVDALFSKAFAARNQLLDGMRSMKQ